MCKAAKYAAFLELLNAEKDFLSQVRQTILKHDFDQAAGKENYLRWSGQAVLLMEMLAEHLGDEPMS